MDNESIISLALFMFLIEFIGISFLIYFVYKKFFKKRTFKAKDGISDPLSVPYRTVQDEVEGTQFFSHYTPRTKGSPSRLVISTPVSTNAYLEISQERTDDRLFKNLNYTKEIQTFDHEFDDKFYIATEDEEFTKVLLQNPEARLAIQEILEYDFAKVEIKGGNLSTTMSPVETNNNSYSTIYTKVKLNFIKIIKALPQSNYQFPSPVTPSSKLDPALFVKVSFFISFIGLCLVFIGSIVFKPIDMEVLFFESLKISVGFIVGYLVLFFFIFHGRSTAHRKLFNIILLALIGIPLLCFGAASTLNGLLDTAPSQKTSVVIVDKHFTSGKSESYYLTLESWKTPGETKTIQVDYDTYNRVVPGQNKLQIDLKPGFLKYEWMEGYRVE